MDDKSHTLPFKLPPNQLSQKYLIEGLINTS